MNELEATLNALVNAEIQSPRQITGGVRLCWSAKRRELLIACVNARPTPEAMRGYKARIRAAGYEIKAERAGEPIEESLNTWLGYALALEPAKEPEPSPQLPLI